MKQEEIDEYRTNLERMVYDYLREIEKKYGVRVISILNRMNLKMIIINIEDCNIKDYSFILSPTCLD